MHLPAVHNLTRKDKQHIEPAVKIQTKIALFRTTEKVTPLPHTSRTRPFRHDTELDKTLRAYDSLRTTPFQHNTQ